MKTKVRRVDKEADLTQSVIHLHSGQSFLIVFLWQSDVKSEGIV